MCHIDNDTGKLPEMERCPFCHGQTKIVGCRQGDGEIVYDAAYVECTKCHAKSRTYITGGYYGISYTEEEIILDWNAKIKACTDEPTADVVAGQNTTSDCTRCREVAKCRHYSPAIRRINCPLWRHK